MAIEWSMLKDLYEKIFWAAFTVAIGWVKIGFLLGVQRKKLKFLKRLWASGNWTSYLTKILNSLDQWAILLGYVKRIDALVNAEWMTSFPHLDVLILYPYFSYHTPLCIQFVTNQRRDTRIFKFFNILAEHPDFLSIATKSWSVHAHCDGLNGVWHKLKHVKVEMQ